MNKSNKILQTLYLLIATSGFLAVNSFAKADDQCWAEFYDKTQFAGEHFRVAGPSQMATLKDVSGDDWDLRIDSIKIGPHARVIVYENKNFKLTLREIAKYPDLMRSLGITEQDVLEDSELIFNSKSMVHDLSEYNFHRKTRSLKVECISN